MNLGYDPELEEEQDEDLVGDPAPISSVAGPQTPRDQVMRRISEVRDSTGSSATPDPERDGAAMQYARDSAMTAGLGRAVNALAAGTGYKPDNSAYDAMEKRGSDLMNQEANRSAAVRRAIEARKGKEAAIEAAQENRKNSLLMDQTRLNEAARHNHAMEALAAKRAGTMIGKNRDIEQLPAEDAEVVKDLAKKNASKIAIANQIEAVMGNWDALPEDQKVAQGRQLIKVLNSTEGADAVGSEEAKRLGGKLEFAMGNLFNSNPTQFGRDLPGFKEQASGTARGIREAIRANEIESNRRYRTHGIARQDPPELERTQVVGRGAGGVIPEAKAGSGRVTVSNGKETLSIELSDLPDAIQDGFQPVKR